MRELEAQEVGASEVESRRINHPMADLLPLFLIFQAMLPSMASMQQLTSVMASMRISVSGTAAGYQPQCLTKEVLRVILSRLSTCHHARSSRPG